MARANQTPEQAARENIDSLLTQAGWAVQDKNNIDPKASLGLAIREYQTDVGPADYVLFIDRKPVGPFVFGRRRCLALEKRAWMAQ